MLPTAFQGENDKNKRLQKQLQVNIKLTAIDKNKGGRIVARHFRTHSK